MARSSDLAPLSRSLETKSLLNPNEGVPVILIVQVAVFALSSIRMVFLHCLVSTAEFAVGVGVFGVAVGVGS